MADEKAKITVDGDLSPLRQKLREAARDFKAFGDEGKASFEGMAAPLKALQDKFIAIGALLAGGAVFKAAVNEAAKFTEESMKLGNALGISATEASTFIATLADIDVSQQEFVSAAQGMAKQIRTNEEALRGMGLQTRDAAGNLRPLNELVVEGVGILNDYKAGTDRAIAGQVMFGKSFDINSNLAKLNGEALKENAELQKRLGAVVGEDNVEAWKAYDQAMDQSSLTLKALKTTIGNAVMPVLTKLGEWFVSIGPAAITVVKGAVGGLIAAFWALKNGVVVVWETINAMVVTVAEPLRAVSEAIWKGMQGDFQGAWAALAQGGETIKNAWQTALDEMAASSQETRDRIWALFNSSGPAAAPSGGKSAAGLVEPDKDKKGPKQQFTDTEWSNLEAEHLKKTLDELARIEQEYQDARVAYQKKADDALLRQIDEQYRLRVEAARDAELDRIESAENAARHELDMGNITQAEYLARLEQFNQQRLAAELRFIEAKKQMEMEDPDKNLVALEQLEIQKAEIRRRYAEQGLEIQRQQALEAQNIFQQISASMSSLWDKMVNSIMQGTFTWRNLAQAVFVEIAGIFGSMVKNMFMKWVQNQIMMMIFGKTAALSEITAMAGKAGAGGVASMAAAPFPINLTAPAFGAAMSTAAMAYAPMVAARGGYDIPAGLNPVAQLHQEEMVLPAHLANVIRDMASSGGGEGGGGTRIINAVDPSLVEEYLNSSAGEKVILNVIRANPGAVKQMLY